MAAGIQILHVDDEPDFLSLTKDYLNRHDDRLTTETVSNIDEALELLSQKNIDCIVSDYDMPRTNGLEFLGYVRDDYPQLPFILFTGKGSEEIASQAISEGVTDYIQKGGTESFELLANRIVHSVEEYRIRHFQHRAKHDPIELVERISDAFLALNEDFEFTYLNEQAAEIFGKPAAELLGANIWDEFPEAKDTPFYDHYIEALETGESKVVEEYFEPWNRWYQEQIYPSGGGLSVLFRDITELKRQEEEREVMLDFLQGLYSIATDPTLGHDEKITRLLQLGHEKLDLPYGTLTRIETGDGPGDEGIQAIIVASGDHDLLQPGETSPLSKSYCRKTIEQDGILEVSDAIVDGWEGDPAFEVFQLGSYIGIPVTVNDELYGTLFFAGTEPRSDPYTDAERTFIHLMSQLVSYELEHKQYIEDLRVERERFESIFEHSNDAILILDPVNDSIVAANPRAEDLLGYTQDELRTDVSISDIHQEHIDEFRSFLEEVREVGSGRTEEFHCRTKDGEFRDAEIAMSRLDIDEGDYVLASVRDLTERKQREVQLRRERSRLNALFENSNDSIVFTEFVDGEPLLQEVNDAFVETFGYSEDEAIGRPIDELVVPDDSDKSREATELNRRIEAGERVIAEVRRQTQDGVRDFLLQSTPLELGESNTETYAIYSDITDRKERERTLERQNERLDAFTSVVSHDLRNPLNVASGRLELAKDDCDTDHLAEIDHALDRMETLIDDLHELARQGESVGEREPVALAELVENCWATVGATDATLDTDVERIINADKSRLKQFFENLFRNALEHGGEEVTVTVGELDDGFYVEDDGPGIPDEEREDIFEAGYSTSTEGTGFGLSIVKEIAEAHGWEISVTEGRDGGARFEIIGVEA